MTRWSARAKRDALRFAHFGVQPPYPSAAGSGGPSVAGRVSPRRARKALVVLVGGWVLLLASLALLGFWWLLLAAWLAAGPVGGWLIWVSARTRRNAGKFFSRVHVGEWRM